MATHQEQGESLGPFRDAMKCCSVITCKRETFGLMFRICQFAVVKALKQSLFGVEKGEGKEKCLKRNEVSWSCELV